MLIVAWAVYTVRPYLNFDPLSVPLGGEFMGSIQTHHFWTRVQECGLCALWYGSAAGGTPAFGDFTAHMLNPLVMATTLAWGVLNGAKATMIGAFILAGLAQWWLAWELGAGRLARVWIACLAVVGGHLGMRVEHGPGFLMNLTICTLAFPALLRLARLGTPRAAVLLGLLLGLAFADGVGYAEVGLLWTMPATLVLVPWHRAEVLHFARRLVLAAVIALLLAAPTLIPLAHFMPQIVKSADLQFSSAQPLYMVPLNLVINDLGFYNTPIAEINGRKPTPLYYANFIGLIPVALGVLGLVVSRGVRRRQVTYLGMAAGIVFLIAAAVPQSLVVRLVPIATIQRLVSSGEFPPVLASLAIPPLLGLATVGLQWIVERTGGPRSAVLGLPTVQTERRRNAALRWLLVIPLVVAFWQAVPFNTAHIAVQPMSPSVPTMIDALRTPDLQWVRTPIGSAWHIEPAVRAGLKRSDEAEYRSWRWRDRQTPPPVLLASRDPAPPGWTEQGRVDDYRIYVAPPGNEYAAVTHENGGRTVCRASGAGGSVDVHCALAEPGTLTVTENNWSGWQAWLGGNQLPLGTGQWLSVPLPAGTHVVELRYRPWDVALGTALAAIGLILFLVLWFRRA